MWCGLWTNVSKISFVPSNIGFLLFNRFWQLLFSIVWQHIKKICSLNKTPLNCLPASPFLFNISRGSFHVCSSKARRHRDKSDGQFGLPAISKEITLPCIPKLVAHECVVIKWLPIWCTGAVQCNVRRNYLNTERSPFGEVGLLFRGNSVGKFLVKSLSSKS